MNSNFLSLPRLTQIRDYLKEDRQHIRGEDGFEVPFHALPITPEELTNVLNELIVRRGRDGS